MREARAQPRTFEVSAGWIHRHRTPAGGWTAKALMVLGVAWPPAPGWVQRVEGKLLTEHERRVFESQGRHRRPRQVRLPFET